MKWGIFEASSIPFIFGDPDSESSVLLQVFFLRNRCVLDLLGAGISEDSTKYHALVSALDSRILSQARDIVLAPPRDNAYTALKERIISLFSQSERARLRQLLQDLHLGDLRPSQLLSQMKNLAGDKTSAELLRTLWLQRLPIRMQQILSACKDVNR
ncbi:hypothetical protein AVEN_79965-1 [Araneus ventricosus]|uniref:DUF7041 domain-containing protein n=1 Tax=Araneus ventricosus TaxID=182803 RepID=A0A4Y2GCL2_ARAVE|nr:hypothetical protein AVEN_79965-1 [Araneus ventricosus]